MAIFLIIDIKVENKAKYLEYVRNAEPIIKKYKGKYVVKTNDVTFLSGNWKPERIVIIEFPSKVKMQECFNSEDYKSIKYLREESTTGKTIIVEKLLNCYL